MLRFLIAFPAALFVSFSLVGVMAWMVELNTRELSPEPLPLQFDIFATEQEQTSQRKIRLLPEPPEPQPKAPKPEQVKLNLMSDAVTANNEKLPELDPAVSGLDISIPSPSVQQPELTKGKPAINPVKGNSGNSQQLMPLHRIEPVYPRKALQRAIEGYVLLTFDIGKTGRPENIKVTQAQPAGIFNRAAIRALKRWRYQPVMVNGSVQTVTGQQIKLEFRIK
ncbi:energy transducer TonB [Vibrio sp. JC009]|uniref:energy transducer TonB n=1 Tax=Vibrio sp. JC009 TaxID=2912314 RepID=UPI0023AE8DB5|nr:energy transducer TonB [Vibrio sp. JC009]WED24307.1 energy transducer TonB [Vibrio sp. JC009]